MLGASPTETSRYVANMDAQLRAAAKDVRCLVCRDESVSTLGNQSAARAATAARSLDNRDDALMAPIIDRIVVPQRLLGASTTETETRHGYRIVYCLAAKDARCLSCRDRNKQLG